MIAASEVHELLTKIPGILDSGESKQVSNIANILASLFISVSRQHCGVWASQFTFLNNFKDSVLPSEACLCGHINWSLAQAHQQSSLRLSQSSTTMMGARAKQKARF